MDARLKIWMEHHELDWYDGFQTKELAQYLNISPRTIQRWMKDTFQPSEIQLVRIEEFTKKTLDKKQGS